MMVSGGDPSQAQDDTWGLQDFQVWTVMLV
jgi:hypothetical protein